MYSQQKGLCLICLSSLELVKKICVDHHHTSGKIRGLLCSECNVGIGFLRDDADNCERAADYLRRALPKQARR